MKDIIVIAILVVIVAAVIFYIYRAKKNGQKCIGCPESCSCSKKNAGGGCYHSKTK